MLGDKCRERGRSILYASGTISGCALTVVWPYERGEIGPELFRVACGMMPEGLVFKRSDSHYSAGPSRAWVKIKNPSSPCMNRGKNAFRLTV